MTIDSPITIGSLVQVAQHATDLDVSAAFYQDVLGGRLLGKFDPPGLALVELGGVRLLLERQASRTTLYFRVDDLDAVYTALRQRNVLLVGEPHLVHRDDAGQFGPPGEEEWMTFARDPDGNMLGFIERRAPASR
jgi:catechol 2,3-dioxygenase-like lactoylglutathione lyase family enzyme